MIGLQQYSFSGIVSASARAGGRTTANMRRPLSMPRKRNNPVSLSREDRGSLEGLIAGGHAPARQLTPCAHPAQGRRGRRCSPPSLLLARHQDRRCSGDKPLDGRSGAPEVRLGGVGGGAGPPQAKGHQTQQARWRAGGPPDRSGLLGASEGQKALERTSSGRAFRSAGVCRRAHLPRACKAHSQKSAIKPWLKGQWSIPPKQDAAFCWRMEDVLEVYTSPYDERFPQVCPDEKSKQLVAEVESHLPPTQDEQPVKTTSMSVRGRPTSSSFPNLW